MPFLNLKAANFYSRDWCFTTNEVGWLANSGVLLSLMRKKNRATVTSHTHTAFSRVSALRLVSHRASRLPLRFLLHFAVLHDTTDHAAMKEQGCSPASSSNRPDGCWACHAGWLGGRSPFWCRAGAAPPASISVSTGTRCLHGCLPPSSRNGEPSGPRRNSLRRCLPN